MIEKKGEFFGGVGLMAGFVLVLIIIFMPIFNGRNGLNYLDALYNSISKGSAYFIPQVKEEVGAFKGVSIEVEIGMASKEQAEQSALLFMKSGAMVNVSDRNLKIRGDLGAMLASSLEDSHKMFHNDSQVVSEKYGYDARRVLFNWWMSFKLMEKALNAQKKFKEAKGIALVVKRAVEVAFNFYQIEPQNIQDKFGIVSFSLIFYVIYTLWYGFAILFMFEGWGLKLEH
jgi:hypothetical protein